MVATREIESYTNTLDYVLKYTHGKMKRKISLCPHRLNYLIITHMFLRIRTKMFKFRTDVFTDQD